MTEKVRISYQLSPQHDKKFIQNIRVFGCTELCRRARISKTYLSLWLAGKCTMGSTAYQRVIREAGHRPNSE